MFDAHSADGTVCHRHNLICLQPVDKVNLRTLGKDLNLVHSGPDLTVRQHVRDQLNSEVRHTDTPGETKLHK